MKSEENELVDLIDAAWHFECPPVHKVSVDTYDDEGTQQHFWRTEWRDHSVKMLRQHESALVFFTPEAYHYYLPAFIIVAVVEPEEADVILDGIIFSLNRAFLGDGLPDVISLFSQQQREALASYVEYSRHHPASREHDSLIEILRRIKNADIEDCFGC